MDHDAPRIASLNHGVPPLHEPGLEELIARNREEERLRFTVDLKGSVADSLMIFLCTGTPANEQGHADVSGILELVRQIGKSTDGYRIIVNKTTCPPGTADLLEAAFRENTPHPCDVVVNPDFMKEGSAVDDFLRPDRVIVGCEDVRVREILKELYNPFLRTGKPFLAMSRRGAEMAKYATNVMLAARISLMNELADICEACQCDVSEVREAVGMDHRIGSMFLFPGIGFGGSGLPRDLATCEELARGMGVDHEMITAIRCVNDKRRKRFLERILTYYGEKITDKRLTIWGVSFKARTDDMRGAPALDIIDGLLNAGASITIYDPVAGPKIKERYSNRVVIAPKYYNALEQSDGLIVLTEWNEFRRPDYARMGGLMREKVIFDGRNLYTPSVMAENGFQYFSIGRAMLMPKK